MKAFFSEVPEALARLPVPEALKLTGRWRLPLQMLRRRDECRQGTPRLAPTKADGVVDLTALLKHPRPRDQTSTAAATWEGVGRHGEGVEEEGIDVDCSDASDDPTGPCVEAVDDEAVDQGVEEKQLEDPPLHPHPPRPA